jgi:hypothetical protein
MYEVEIYLSPKMDSLHYLSVYDWHLEISADLKS